VYFMVKKCHVKIVMGHALSSAVYAGHFMSTGLVYYESVCMCKDSSFCVYTLSPSLRSSISVSLPLSHSHKLGGAKELCSYNLKVCIFAIFAILDFQISHIYVGMCHMYEILFARQQLQI
jgi:hypothetical protein